MWGLYALFDDAVAAAFCENPTNPSCHGRCHVAKTTTKGEKERAQGPEIDLPKILPFIACSSTVVFDEPAEAVTGLYHQPALSAGFPRSVYHPPLSFSLHTIC